jgi:hypothetical protein
MVGSVEYCAECANEYSRICDEITAEIRAQHEAQQTKEFTARGIHAGTVVYYHAQTWIGTTEVRGRVYKSGKGLRVRATSAVNEILGNVGAAKTYPMGSDWRTSDELRASAERRKQAEAERQREQDEEQARRDRQTAQRVQEAIAQGEHLLTENTPVGVLATCHAFEPKESGILHKHDAPGCKPFFYLLLPNGRSSTTGNRLDQYTYKPAA